MAMYKARCINGIWEEEKMIFVDKRLKYLPYGQCGVCITEKADFEDYTLISYATPILTLRVYHGGNDSELFRYPCPVNCSRSTIRHVSCFLREYTESLTYHDVKRLFVGNDKGETIDSLCTKASFFLP